MTVERTKLRSLNSALSRNAFSRQDVVEEEIETEQRSDRLDPALGRVEPFHALAAVEQCLQPDHGECESCQAEEVDGRFFSGLFSEATAPSPGR